MFNKNKNRGFTLIELLVVITIIGTLSGIVVVAMQGHTERARIAALKTFRHSIHMRIGENMVGNWPLDSAVGTPPVTHDRSGWGNQGTLTDANHANADGNTPPTFVPGVIGQGLRFDGVDDFVEMPNRPSLDATSAITVESWINPIEAKGQSPVRMDLKFSTRIDGDRHLRPHVHVGGSWHHMTSRSLYELNRWTHYVLTYDSVTRTMILHLNGVEDNRLVLPPGLPTHLLTSTGSPLFIGADGVRGEFVNGSIDEVRIYRAAMPTSYIQKRYVQGIKGLVANGGITEEEKQGRLAVLRNSGHLAINLDSALAGNIDFSQYDKYLAFEK